MYKYLNKNFLLILERSYTVDSAIIVDFKTFHDLKIILVLLLIILIN